MKLSNEQIKELLKKPKNSHLILEGRKYESRLRLFTESKSKEELENEVAWLEYKSDLQQKLSKQKFEKICQYINYPLSIVDIANSCSDELNKVFDARNAYFNNEFLTSQIKKKVEPILQKVNVKQFIIEKGKEVIKNKPNTIVVVDKDDKGNPYLLPICMDRLFDFELEEEEDKGCAEFSYIIFIHSVVMNGEIKETRYSVYDDEFYRVYLVVNDSIILETENAHTAGECPARMFMTDRLNSKSKLNRKIPFSNIISKMKEWQNFDTFKYYTDHYAPFPVLEAPESKCQIDNCNNGVISEERDWIEDGAVRTKTILTDCPVCKSKDLIGPGTVIRVPAKLDKDDPTESGVFKMISNPTDTLTYIDNKLDKIESHIIYKTVGMNTMIQDVAINESQVKGSYDSRQNVLISLKTNFDKLYEWCNETIANLISPKSGINIVADFGTEFYLLSEDDLQARFDSAKKVGLPESEVDSIFKQLIETKYKGNNAKIDRSIMLKYLDPLPYKTLNETISLFEKGIISDKELILKLELIRFVDRFEMENTPLTEFGLDLNPWVRVQKILETINKYIDERGKIQQVQSSTGSN